MSYRTKICPICGKSFSYEVARGSDRKYCDSKKCQLERKYIARQNREYKKCKVGGCEEDATRVSAGLCETHYYRKRRNGTYNARVVAGRYITGAGYVKLLKPEHPMADSKGHVFEHRYIMYEHLGGGEHECYWCGAKGTWDKIVIDHLDENKQNNTVGNLVVSCNNCNRARGAVLPFIKRMRPDALPVFIERVKHYAGG